jgi:hypothetical protein
MIIKSESNRRDILRDKLVIGLTRNLHSSLPLSMAFVYSCFLFTLLKAGPIGGLQGQGLNPILSMGNSLARFNNGQSMRIGDFVAGDPGRLCSVAYAALRHEDCIFSREVLHSASDRPI